MSSINPAPIAIPNTACITKAKLQAKRGLGVCRASIPLPSAGMKKNHGTTTLMMPKMSPSKIDGKMCYKFIIMDLSKIKLTIIPIASCPAIPNKYAATGAGSL